MPTARARQTPVFFGSALNDFGVEPFLHALLSLAPSPGPRDADVGPIEPPDTNFSGFVFKIQANMNPRHRDRVAFLRICSGRLAKDMTVVNARLGTPLRLSRVYRFFGRDRETVPEAFPGDVVGVVNPGPHCHRRHAVRRQARPVPADSAVPVGAIRDASSRRCAAQALRRGDRAACGGGADSGVHADLGRAQSDRRRHRHAAARCGRGANVVGVRHRVHRSTACHTSRRDGRSNR